MFPWKVHRFKLSTEEASRTLVIVKTFASPLGKSLTSLKGVFDSLTALSLSS